MARERPPLKLPATLSSGLERIKLARRRSLSTELAVSLVLLVLLVEGTLLFLVYRQQADDLYTRLVEKADEYAVNLSETLAVPIWDLDDEQIRRIGDGFARNELVASVLVRDAEGNVYYRFERDGVPTPIVREVPIVHTGQTIGHARIALSLHTYRSDLVWLRNMTLVVLGLSLVVIVIATGIVLRVLMRKPLTILQQGMDRVARGDDDYRFEEIHHGELADIARRFNTMADRVRVRERSLQKEIAERKRAEQKIRESDARTRAILDAIPDVLFQFDRDGRFLDMRGDPANLTVTPEQCIGRRIEHVMPGGIARLFRTQLNRTFGSRRLMIFEYTIPFGDEPHHYESRLVAVSDDLALGMVRDISEQVNAAAAKRRLVEQLQRAQKMEAIGMLAGGVAHDLNNILSGLVSYPELILMDLPEDSPLQKPIRTIQASGERAANIVQDLLTLARRGVSISEMVDLNGLINDYLKSPEYENLKAHHPDTRLDTRLADDLLNIVGSPIHLAKTVMNLVSNAAEATLHGGTVRIETVNRYIDAPVRGYVDIEEGDYVVLTVADNGIGISKEDIERIFEPFYTKKVMGRSGTGLGLAIVWNVVQDHEGYIDVQSDAHGTTFKVYFPITRVELADDSRAVPVEAYMGGGESILVVDDMAAQREIACTFLEKLGYRPQAAASGQAAVDYLKDHAVDLVLLDMIMDPGINGRETYARISKLHPGQRAVIVSGFAETEEVKRTQQLGAGLFVKKPYSLEKLGIAIRRELDKGKR